MIFILFTSFEHESFPHTPEQWLTITTKPSVILLAKMGLRENNGRQQYDMSKEHTQRERGLGGLL